MFDNPSAEIIAIGTEILLGEITDTNSVFIARTLRDYGVNVFFMTSVGDNEARIAHVIEQALQRADIIITCGGLGPTVDDMTRTGIAQAVGVDLEFRQELLDQITARFSNYRVKMTDNNRRQAYLPVGATAIHNPVGTAPAFVVEAKNRLIFSLPGVPREMKYLLNEAVIPALQRRYVLGVIRARKLRVAGIGESSLDDLIGSDLLSSSNPTVGLAAHHGTIDIRVAAKAPTISEADEMVDQMVSSVMERAGAHVFGYDEDRLDTVVAELLRSRNTRVKIVQAGLGTELQGELSLLASAVPENVDVTVYDTPTDLYHACGYDDSTSFHEAANQLVQTMGDSANQPGIVIISNPDVAEQADVDEATVVVVNTGNDIHSRSYGFGAKHELTAVWVTRWALSILWRSLKESLHVD